MVAVLVLAGPSGVGSEPAAVTPQITVDQFGWLPRSAKVAILADPVKGQNAGQTYHPGDRFEIRREPDGNVGLPGQRRSRGTRAR